jgi:WD40 repeat protein
MALVAMAWVSCARLQAADAPATAPATQPARLVINLQHSLDIRSACFSPDARLILTAGSDSTARLWDVASGRLVRTLEGHSAFLQSAEFSPDGKLMLTAGGDSTRLWDFDTGSPLRQFQVEKEGAMHAIFVDGGRRVLKASANRTVSLWETDTGKFLRITRFDMPKLSEMRLARDGKVLMTANSDHVARLWDVQTGQLLKSLEGHTGMVNAIALSADGNLALTGGYDNAVCLWETSSGALVRRLGDHPGLVSHVEFSPDGKLVVTGCWDNRIRIWETATGRLLHTGIAGEVRVSTSAFARDGSLLATFATEEGYLWDVSTGSALRRLGTASDAVRSVALTPDGTRLIAGGFSTVPLWDLQTGQVIRRFLGPHDSASSIAVSPDGKHLLTAHLRGDAAIWDLQTAREIHRLSGHLKGLCDAAFSPDGRRIITGSEDKTARLWDAATGALIRDFGGHTDRVACVSFSPDGSQVLTGSWDKSVRIRDSATGRMIAGLDDHACAVSCAVYSPDGRLVATDGGDHRAILWEAHTGRRLRDFVVDPASVDSIAFSPDGRHLLLGDASGGAWLFETDTARLVQQFKGHSGWVNSVVFAPGARQIITAGNDLTTRVWDIESGKDRCRFVAFEDGTWAVVDPEGRFDASNGGDIEGMHWVVGLEPIALSQLKHRYYDPGLLAKIMGSNRQPLRPVPPLDSVGLFPELNVAPLRPGQRALQLGLTNRGGGIGRVQVFVNDKELSADARGGAVDPSAETAQIILDLSNVALAAGRENRLRIVTWNQDGYLSSRGVELVIPEQAAVPEQPPRMHAIVVGVSDYASPQLHLRFAAKDARDFARALDLGARRMLGKDNVHISLLCTGADRPPSRDNIKLAFAQLKQAGPNDVLVVYLAGHGVALAAENDLYLFLTPEARSTDSRALSDPAYRAVCSISSDELAEWTNAAPPLKQVLILDTCAAGAAAARLIDKREVAGEQIRALERYKDRTGCWVLMGSAADAVSYEASQYGQGLLTWSLLQGMKGASLRQDRFVDVSLLFQHAADQVPQLARNIGGVQRPNIAVPARRRSTIAPTSAPGQLASFDIGELDAADRASIPLASLKPLVLRPVLLDQGEMSDSLGLSTALTRSLRQQGIVTARGESKYVFVDAAELPGAVQPSGLYTVAGDKVEVKLVLKQDNRKLADLSVQGDKSDPAALAQAIADRITRSLENQPGG